MKVQMFFPTISQLEEEAIQELSINKLAQNGSLRILPWNEKLLLENSYGSVCDRIKSTAQNGSAVAFATFSVRNTIDIWIFRSGQPTLLLTFITDESAEETYLEHNRLIAEMTTKAIRSRTDLDFSLINCVIDKETGMREAMFSLKLEEIETRNAALKSLTMDQPKFAKAITSFKDFISGNAIQGRQLMKNESVVEEKKPPVRCLVVYSEEHELDFKNHVDFLERAGFQTSPLNCKDTDTMTSMDMRPYDRIDLLVDSTMCSILKNGQQLKEVVLQTFKEIEMNGTEIVLYSLFLPDDNGDDFNEVFHQVPRKVRKRPEESAYHVLLPQLEKPKADERSYIRSVQVGYKNKATVNSASKQCVLLYQRGANNILNIVAPENSQLKISTRLNPDQPEVEEKIITVMKKQQEDIQKSLSGVSSYVIEKGSIVIKLDLEPGQMVTDQWLTTVLQALFTDEVCSLIPNGVSMDLEIDATVVLTAEDISKLGLDSSIHENCVSRSVVEDLQLENEWLKKKISGPKAQQISDWMDKATIDTSSGIYTAQQISDWMDKATIGTESGIYTGSTASSVDDSSEDREMSTLEADGAVLDSHTKECHTCEKALLSYKKICNVPLFILHVPRMVFQQGKRQKMQNEPRTTLKRTLEKCVSGLLNSGGGKIIIHLDGQAVGDQNLLMLDEFISGPLSKLLGDGQSFINTFSRHWLRDNTGFETFPHSGVVLQVNQSKFVTTADFKTKYRTDNEQLNPSPLQIMSTLCQPAKKAESPQIKGIVGIVVDEYRNTVLKTLIAWDGIVETFDDYIWQDLKLMHTITSMSKIPGGGSYYIGIFTNRGHKVDGIVMMPHDRKKVTERLYSKLKTDMCVLNKTTMTFHDVPSDLIEIAFHPVPGKPSETVVMEVAIGYYDGIVFYDKEGPKTYKLVDGRLCRMDKKEWLKRIRHFPVFQF